MNEVTLIAIASAAIGVAVGVLLNIHEAKARVVTKKPRAIAKSVPKVDPQVNQRRRYTDEEDLRISRVRTRSGIIRLSRETGRTISAIKTRRNELRKMGKPVSRCKRGRPPFVQS